LLIELRVLVIELCVLVIELRVLVIELRVWVIELRVLVVELRVWVIELRVLVVELRVWVVELRVLVVELRVLVVTQLLYYTNQILITPYKLFFMKTNMLFIYYLLSSIASFAQSGNFGNGSDGNITISTLTSLPINAQQIMSVSGSVFNVGSVSGYVVNTPVLIIQMTGAGAGTNEYAKVASISGNDLGFIGLVNTYEPLHTQIIKLYQYDNMDITATGELTTSGYNAATGTGGVLSFLIKNKLTVLAGGKMTMNAKGFDCGSAPSAAGTGGVGGAGGVATLNAGGDGGNTGIGGRGLFGGGNGAAKGGAGSGSIVSTALNCPFGITPGSSNASDIPNKKILLGTSGASGSTGASGVGAGGGGAGAGNNTLAGNDGTAGGDGGIGGIGGTGGLGGGLILFKVNESIYPTSSIVFEVKGGNGGNGNNGSTGGNGGIGGAGAGYDICAGTMGSSGGGGNGADGGAGGAGGAAGAGGFVLVTRNKTNRALLTPPVMVEGSSFGGSGGTGGAGGKGGTANASTNATGGPCGGGGGPGSGGTSHIFIRTCNIAVFRLIVLTTSNGTGNYTGTATNGNSFVFKIEPSYDVNYADISYTETDSGGNTTTIFASAINIATGILSDLISAVDANGACNGSALTDWVSVCEGFGGEDGTPGIDGLDGLDGDAKFYEDIEIPLPIHLLSFDGQHTKTQNDLQWTSATEQNSATYAIERSTDGEHFTTIGSLKAAGDSNTKQNYAFQDTHIQANDLYYYRLNMIDMDGTQAYSKTIALSDKNNGVKVLTCQPNPALDAINVVFTSKDSAAETIGLTIQNLLGTVLLSQTINTNQSTAIDLNHLPAGCYVLVTTTPNGAKYSQKFIKL
jgi:ABC-type cobalt transport system substrate-binding protein